MAEGAKDLAKAPAGPVIRYETASGDIELTFDVIRKYLIRGKGELATNQELMLFAGVCKARKLNPFNNDCYPVKYTAGDPLAIIVSVDFLRARARRQLDCQGWKAGIIVERNGDLVYREGHLILEGERLVGGWFEALPKNWLEPKKHTVPLKPYIKKKTDGSITQFWAVDKQPMMIAKVAEAQGLRMTWPDDLGCLYTQEETPEVLTLDAAVVPPPLDTSGFDSLVEGMNPAKEEREKLSRFLEEIASLNQITVEEVKVKAGAQADFPDFWAVFCEWQMSQGAPAPEPAATGETREKAPPEEAGKEPAGDQNAASDSPAAGPSPAPPPGGRLFDGDPSPSPEMKKQVSLLADLADHKKVPMGTVQKWAKEAGAAIRDWEDLYQYPDAVQAIRAKLEKVAEPKGAK